MPISFPTSLDVLSTVVDNTTAVAAVHFNDIRNAVEAIEAKIGVNSSAVAASLDYLLKDTTGGHDHDGTDSRRVSDLKSGDWMISTVTTNRTGWTNVTATYADRFMRINATALTLSGAINTHTHGVDTYAGPSHQHGVGSYVTSNHTHGGTTGTPSNTLGVQGDGDPTAGHTHTHSFTTSNAGGGAITGYSGYASGSVTGTSAAGDNVPVFVECAVFQKD